MARRSALTATTSISNVGGCWSAAASSARPAGYRSTRRPSTRWAPISIGPTGPAPPGPRPLLVSTAGTRLLYPNVCRTFIALVADARIQARSARCRPRIHDLRHTFAVRALLDCYRTGVGVDARLPLLSAYLGHANPKDTYWYLTGSPELLALAGQRLEGSLGGRS